MKLIQNVKKCNIFFGLRPVGRDGRGLLYALFNLHSYRGTLNSREIPWINSWKYFHSSFHLVRVFCTVPPGSHLPYFHFLHTLSLPNVCSTQTLPVSYGQLKGNLRNLMRDHTHYDQSKWQLTVIVSDHPTGTHVTVWPPHWGIWPSTQVTHFHYHTTVYPNPS